MASWKVARLSRRALRGSLAAFALFTASVTAQPGVTGSESRPTETTPARASNFGRPPRVIVAVPRDAPALLREAVVRAQGELSAVGLGAEVELTTPGQRVERSAPPWAGDVYGVLELEQRGRWLWIRAWAPRAAQSVDERVDSSAAGVTAEVIAVRAVETLRAAMLEFARRERGGVPEVVKGFTRFTPERVSPSPPAVPPEADGARQRLLSPPLAVWFGPALSLHAGTSPDLGMQLGVLAGGGHFFAAVAFETTLYDLTVRAPQGSADVRRQAAWGQLGARFRPSSHWEVVTRAGGGYASFAVEGRGEVGYRGRSDKHGSAGLMLGIGSTYWATRSFGVYGGVGGQLSLSAPTIVIAGRDVITLDRPSFVLSLGVSVGVF